MREVPMYQVDAFTSRAFRGNPAAVCLVPPITQLSHAEKQIIAAENNLSETAFVELLVDGDTFRAAQMFALSWYTPTREVPMCGHATLAAAAVLFGEVGNSHSTLNFGTLSGVLSVTREGLGNGAARGTGCAGSSGVESGQPAAAAACVQRLSMTLPHVELSAELAPGMDVDVQALLTALGCVWKATEVRYCAALSYVLVALSPAEHCRKDLDALAPDLTALEAAAPAGVAGVIVALCRDEHSPGRAAAAAEVERVPVLSRFFAPWAGIPEDPVTGSAHTALATYVHRELGRGAFAAEQRSRRRGELWVAKASERAAVTVGGCAVTVLRGTLLVPDEREPGTLLPA